MPKHSLHMRQHTHTRKRKSKTVRPNLAPLEDALRAAALANVRALMQAIRRPNTTILTAPDQQGILRAGARMSADVVRILCRHSTACTGGGTCACARTAYQRPKN